MKLLTYLSEHQGGAIMGWSYQGDKGTSVCLVGSHSGAHQSKIITSSAELLNGDLPQSDELCGLVISGAIPRINFLKANDQRSKFFFHPRISNVFEAQFS